MDMASKAGIQVPRQVSRILRCSFNLTPVRYTADTRTIRPNMLGAS